MESLPTHLNLCSDFHHHSDFACPEFHTNGIRKKNPFSCPDTLSQHNIFEIYPFCYIGSLLFLSTITLYEYTTVFLLLLILTWVDVMVYVQFGTSMRMSSLINELGHSHSFLLGAYWTWEGWNIE